jgi:hypothetical protein
MCVMSELTAHTEKRESRMVKRQCSFGIYGIFAQRTAPTYFVYGCGSESPPRGIRIVAHRDAGSGNNIHKSIQPRN